LKVVDTTIAVDHLRGKTEATTLLSTLIKSGEDIVASELTRFELLSGLRDRERQALEAFFFALSWIPVDAEIARAAGEMARQYRKSHSGVDDADYLIAATSVVLDASLLTTNVRHFPMLEGLRPAY
jgi:predicted nucleic acid-binding protein